MNIIIFICSASLLHLLVIATSHLLFGELPLPTPCGSDRAANPSRVDPDLTNHCTPIFLAVMIPQAEPNESFTENLYERLRSPLDSLGSHARDDEAVYGLLQPPPITWRKPMTGGEKMWQHSE